MLLPSQPGDEPLPHDVLVEKSEGYSGSDIRILCKEAAMQPLRRTLASLEDTEEIVPEDGKISCEKNQSLALVFRRKHLTFLVFLVLQSCQKLDLYYQKTLTEL